LLTKEGGVADEESDDDFGANDSRSEYSAKPGSVKKTTTTQSNLNSRSSMPQVKPGGAGMVSSSDDGDFGANDSRSEYSAKIPEEITRSNNNSGEENKQGALSV